MSSDVTYDLALLHKSAAKWRSSATLRSVYGDIFREVERQLAPGRSLEIGSGIETIKDFLPDVVTSDIAVTPYATAVRTEQGVQFEHLLDEACPGAASGLRRSDIVGEQDWDRPQRLLLLLLTPAPASLHARVVRVISDHVFSTIRNIRSDWREEVQWVEKHLIFADARGPLGPIAYSGHGDHLVRSHGYQQSERSDDGQFLIA